MPARCPKCGKPFDPGTSLKQIKAHVRGCGRVVRKKPHTPPPPAQRRQPPALPAVFEIPVKISSQNNTQYAHWSAYRKYREKWYKAVPLFCSDIQGIMAPWSRWSIRRVYTGRSRELDFGNLVGGCKPIPDALIRIGAIPDDTSAHFKAEYSQDRGDREVVIITLWEIRDAAP